MGDHRQRPFGRRWPKAWEDDMPCDPRQCRERALECMELARTAATPDHNRLLTNLAQSWINLATDLEQAAALMETYPPADVYEAISGQSHKPH
jgi:hypothetical protein